METLIERPGFTILHDTDKCWLYVTWQGKRTSQSSYACFEAILAQVRAKNSAKILNDSSLDLDGWGNIVEWVGRDFFTLLAKEGVTAVAWVMPHNLQAIADVHKVMAVITRPSVNTFTDMEGAYSWLASRRGISHARASC